MTRATITRIVGDVAPAVLEPVIECNKPRKLAPCQRKVDEGTRETVRVLYSQGVKADFISEQTGVKIATIHAWAFRFKWKQAIAAAKQHRAVMAIKRDDPLSQASEALRADFADILSKHTTEAKRIAGTANVKRLRAIGEALEPFARIAKIVHGWGSESVGGMVAAEYLSADQEHRATVTAITNVSGGDTQPQQPQGQAVTPSPEAPKPVDPATLP